MWEAHCCSTVFSILLLLPFKITEIYILFWLASKMCFNIYEMINTETHLINLMQLYVDLYSLGAKDCK